MAYCNNGAPVWMCTENPIVQDGDRLHESSHTSQDDSATTEESEIMLTSKITLQAGKCVIADDAVEIAQKMSEADVIVFATPIYYYEMCGQMKTLLDRANSLYGTDYRFREIYMLSTAAEDGDSVSQRAENGLQGWIDCYPNEHLAGTVFAGGVDAIGTIKGHSALDSAYEMGRSVSIAEE